MNTTRVDLRRSGSTAVGTVPLLKKVHTSHEPCMSSPSPSPSPGGGMGMGKRKKSSTELLCGCLDGPCALEVCPGSAPWIN